MSGWRGWRAGELGVIAVASDECAEWWCKDWCCFLVLGADGDGTEALRDFVR